MARNRYSQTSPMEAFGALGQGLQGLGQAMNVAAEQKRELLGNQALSMALGSLANPGVRENAETYMKEVNSLAMAFQKVGLSPLPFYQMALQTVPKTKMEKKKEELDVAKTGFEVGILGKKYGEMIDPDSNVLPENLEFFHKRVLESPDKYSSEVVEDSARVFGYSDFEIGELLKQSNTTLKLTPEQQYHMDVLKYSNSYPRNEVDNSAQKLKDQGILSPDFKPSYRKDKPVKGMTGEEWLDFPSADPKNPPIKLRAKHVDKQINDLIVRINTEFGTYSDSKDYKQMQARLENILKVSYGAGIDEEASGEGKDYDETWRMDIDVWWMGLSDEDRAFAEEQIKANPILVTKEWLYRHRDAE